MTNTKVDLSARQPKTIAGQAQAAQLDGRGGHSLSVLSHVRDSPVSQFSLYEFSEKETTHVKEITTLPATIMILSSSWIIIYVVVSK